MVKPSQQVREKGLERLVKIRSMLWKDQGEAVGRRPSFPSHCWGLYRGPWFWRWGSKRFWQYQAGGKGYWLVDGQNRTEWPSAWALGSNAGSTAVWPWMTDSTSLNFFTGVIIAPTPLAAFWGFLNS